MDWIRLFARLVVLELRNVFPAVAVRALLELLTKLKKLKHLFLPGRIDANTLYSRKTARKVGVSERSVKGPSIYDVHTEGEGQAQVDACGRGEGGPAPCGRPHRKLKLESTDVILYSSHAKKLASFYQNFVFGQEKSGHFSAI